MISLEELRKVEPKFEKYSDEELTQIREYLYALGGLVFDRWLAERNGSKNPQKEGGREKADMEQ